MERAKEAVANPLRMLKQFAAYFDRYEGVRVANICGSCGKKAVPLAILGADVMEITAYHPAAGLQQSVQDAHERVQVLKVV